ncbi:MAG: alpha/beta hydrolase [Dehalococcoidia bacterium]|nr:alpha/beta hydrolase [Dehalococcoidia bacterium]
MPQASVNGVVLFYKTYGKGEAIVMIPGLGAGHTSWFRQIPVFKKRFRVVTFDPRGIGRSERLQKGYAFRVLADDVIGLMDHLSIQKAHVLGQSLGGLVAQEVAIDYPERVLKLMLVSSAIAGGDVNPTNPELMEALGYDGGATQVNFCKLDTRKTMHAVIGMSFDRLLYRKAMQFLSRFFVKEEMFDGLSDQLKAIAGHNTIDRVHQIKAQTLVITGAKDRIVSPDGSRALAARIPNAKLVMVEGGSHGFNVEMAARFNREVLGFLGAV